MNGLSYRVNREDHFADTEQKPNWYEQPVGCKMNSNCSVLTWSCPLLKWRQLCLLKCKALSTVLGIWLAQCQIYWLLFTIFFKINNHSVTHVGGIVLLSKSSPSSLPPPSISYDWYGIRPCRYGWEHFFVVIKKWGNWWCLFSFSFENCISCVIRLVVLAFHKTAHAFKLTRIQ